MESRRAGDIGAPRRPPFAGQGDRDRVEEAKVYLEAHLAEDIDLASLSQAVALSPYYLSRLFKAHVGQSAHQYLIRLRLLIEAAP